MKPATVARRLLSLGLVVAALWYLIHTVAANWRQVGSFDWQVQPGLLGLSIVAHVLELLIGVFIWSRVITHFGEPAPHFPALVRIWSFSNAARYIPGTVWQFLAAAQLATQAGVSRLLMLTSLAVHVGIVLVSAIVVSLLTIPWSHLGLGGVPPVAALGLLPVLLVVHPRFLNFMLSLLARMTRRETLRWTGSWAQGIGLLAMAAGSWVFYGVAFLLFLRALAPVSWDAFTPAIGINALSFAAGLLSPLPGGIGVRESAMTGLLGVLQLPAAVAVVLSGLARLWSIAAEVGTALVGLAFGRRAE
jgi:uncharacterized membrane protein YbhN (UPF0104 family)